MFEPEVHTKFRLHHEKEKQQKKKEMKLVTLVESTRKNTNK
jgi:hypothetical protein